MGEVLAYQRVQITLEGGPISGGGLLAGVSNAANHASPYRHIGEAVNHDKAAGARAGAIIIDRNRSGQLNLTAGDGIEPKGIGGMLFQRIDINLVLNGTDLPCQITCGELDVVELTQCQGVFVHPHDVGAEHV